MDDPKKRRAIFIGLIICIIALGFALWLHFTRHSKQENTSHLQQGTAFPAAIALEAFQLTDGNNKPFTNKNLKGHWSLFFFGFTRCPKVCPTTLSILNKAYQILEKADPNNLPHVVFISVDPKRDSPKATMQYAKRFNKHFIGVTGNKASIDGLTKNLGIMHAVAQKSGEPGYQINHSGTIIVINPKGQWAGILMPPFNANVMANDFMAMQGGLD